MQSHVSKETVATLALGAFQPSIAVLSSYTADAICAKDDLTFCQLIAPFCEMLGESVIKDPTNVNRIVRNVRLDFRDLRRGGFLMNSYLSSVLSSCITTSSTDCVEDEKMQSVTTGQYTFNSCGDPPWLDDFRQTLFRLSEPTEHEFLKHYLACVFVVSTNDADPLDQLTKLGQLQHSQQHQIAQQTPETSSTLRFAEQAATPKWFSPNIFKYYVLLHDVTTESDERAETIYQNMKMTYSANMCHLLRINSNKVTNTPTVPDVWSSALKLQHTWSTQTISNLKQPKQQIKVSPPDYEAPPDYCQSMPDHLPLVSTADDGEPVMTTDTLEPKSYHAELIPHALSNADLTAKGSVESLNRRLFHSNKEQLARKEKKYGCALSASDVDRIRIFVQEFYQRGLLQFVERQIKILHEQVVSRRTMQKSILSATKKWFGGAGGNPNIPTAPLPASSVNTNGGQTSIYSQESAEMQMRRLADLAFLFQQYEFAFTYYHHLKRDFANDQAWLYYAGALEMASLCIFLLGQNANRPFPSHYIDSALTTYMSTCRRPYLGARLCFLSSKIFQLLGDNSKAADHYIRSTSGDSDLCSAVFLELASQCFLVLKMPRKFSLHLILAGHRYSKSGQRYHAMRCYENALVAYQGRNWTLAEDHVNFTLGCHSSHLGDREKSVTCFERLFSNESQQTASQQLAFCVEYFQSIKKLGDSNYEKSAPTTVPMPELLLSRTRVFLGSNAPVSVTSHASLFERFEKVAWQLCFNRGSFKSFIDVLDPSTLNNSTVSTTPNCEPFCVELWFNNFLKVPLILQNVRLLWSMETQSPDEALKTTNERVPVANLDSLAHVARTFVLPKVIMLPEQTKQVMLYVIPMQQGNLNVSGIGYTMGVPAPRMFVQSEEGDPQTPHLRLAITDVNALEVDPTAMVSCMRFLLLQGKRLNTSKEEKLSVCYATDKRLQPKVGPILPLLEVSFLQPLPPSGVLAGQIVHIPLTITNAGSVPVTGISMVVQEGILLCLDEFEPEKIERETIGPSGNVLVHRLLSWEKFSHAPLLPGEHRQFNLKMVAPQLTGPFQIALLLFYQNERNYRSIRLCLSSAVHACLSITSLIIPPPSSMLSPVVKLSMYLTTQTGILVENAEPVKLFDQVSVEQLVSAGKRYRLTKNLTGNAATAEPLSRGHAQNLCVLFEKNDVMSPDMNDYLSVLECSGQPSIRPADCADSHFPWFLATNLQEYEQQSILVVLWKALNDGQTVDGASWLLLKFEPSPSVSPNISQSARLHEVIEEQSSVLKCQLLYAPVLKHDFAKSALCTVPVVIELHNESQIRKVTAAIQTNVSGGLARFNSVMWCGISKMSVELLPNARRSVNVSVVVAKPGSYDLNSIVIMAKEEVISVSTKQSPVSITGQRLVVLPSTPKSILLPPMFLTVNEVVSVA